MKRPKIHAISSPAQWEVVASPVRAEIAEALRLLGPCSVREVAQALDRPADTLYRHIELLQEAGFVREAGFRKGARNAEQLIDVVADDFVIDFRDNHGEAENRAILQTINAFSWATQRAVRDSAAARQLVFDASARNITINYELSWLTPEKFREVRGLIGRIKRLMDSGKKRREGRLYMTLAVATPVTRKRRFGDEAPPANTKPAVRKQARPKKAVPKEAGPKKAAGGPKVRRG